MKQKLDPKNNKNSSWKILIIDDDEDDYRITKSMLEESGVRKYAIQWAATYREGREALFSGSYDAVLLDYDLGLHSGIELLREASAACLTVPLILFTGRGNYAVDIEAMEAGASLYLAKDEAGPELLERAIRFAIDRKQAEVELRTSEARLRASDRRLAVALEAAQLGTWTYHFDSHILDVDARAQILYRGEGPSIDHHALVAQNVSPDDVPAMQEALARAADPLGDGRYQAVYRILQPGEAGQAVRWLHAWGITEFEGSGDARRAVRLTGATRDVTWEKQAGLALEESNQELRRSQQAVEALAGRLQAVLENSLDAPYRRDLRRNRYDYISPVMEQILGFTIPEMMSMGIEETLERIHPEDRAKVQAGMEQSESEKEGTARLLYRFHCKDGSFRWIADYTTVTTDAQGKAIYRTGVVRDVTEQIHSAEALRASEERFRLASRAVSGVLYDLSLDRHEMFQSDGLERVVGYKPGEEPGGSHDWWPRNIHPEDYPRIQAEQQAAIARGDEGFSYEYRIRHRDGHWVYIWDQGSIVRDAHGRAYRVVGICTDISERVQAKAELEASEEQLRVVIENLPQGLIVVIPEDETLRWNRAALEMHGYQRQTDQLTFLNTLAETFEIRDLNGQPLPFAARPIPRLLASESFRDYELNVHNTQNGLQRVFSYSGVPVEVGGRVTMGLLSIRDVTHEKELEGELRRALAAAEEGQRVLEALMEYVPEGITIAEGPDAYIRMVSRYGQELLGGPHAQQTARQVADTWAVYEKDGVTPLPDARLPLMRAIRQGEVVNNQDLIQINTAGQRLYLSCSAGPIRDADGSITGGIVAWRDVSERIQAEAELREREAMLRQSNEALSKSEATLRDFLENTREGFFSLDRDWRYVYANRRLNDILGIDADSLIGQNFWERWPLIKGTAVETHYRIAMEERVPVHIQAKGVYVPDSWYDISVYPTQDGISVFFIDRTEEKKAQAELVESEKRLRRLVEANLIGINVRDAAGQIKDANSTFLNMIGRTTEDLADGGLSIEALTPAAYREADHAAVQEALSTGTCTPYEKEYLHQDGHSIPAMVGYTRLDEKGENFIGFVLDLSALKEAQTALQDYAEKLKRSNQELEQFAFVASHDLQEPLRKIIMFGESLRKHTNVAADATSVEYLERMQNAAERMRAMINGLLDLSRVTTRGGDFAPVDLTQLVEEVVSDLEPRIQAVKGQVQIEALPSVVADELQIRRLFQNLIGNAIKFHKPDVPPVVRVTGSARTGKSISHVEICVSDNGIGFEPEYANLIFQPFQRLHGRNEYEGAGLGLSICQKIVERHQGKIEVRSTPGEGSTFIIMLPVRQG